ncbi:MAG: hypothetical protein ABI596_14920 [Pyrinomonadaceae bacterium]
MKKNYCSVVFRLAPILRVNRLLVLTVVVLMFLPAGAAAQTAATEPDAPGIVVIKKGWHRDVRNRALDEDPLRGPEQIGRVQQAQKDAMLENGLRAQANLPPIPIPQGAPRDVRDGALPDRLPVRYSQPGGGYKYEVKIRNAGPKTIRGVAWEYVLSDPDTNRELGRHLFSSEQTVRPGKSKTLVGYTSRRPAPVVRVVKAGNASPPHYSEQVVIQTIKYDDGTVWKRTSR